MSGTYIMKTTLALAIAVIAAIAIVAFQGNNHPVHAVNEEFGVDVNTSGNTATSVGTIDTCRVVSQGQTFDIDIFIKSVSNLIAFDAYFQYDSSKMTIQSQTLMFQSAQAGSSVFSTSEALPDTSPGIHSVGAVEYGNLNGDTGSGVLIRLTMKASLTNTGISYAKISKIDENGDGVADFGVTLRNYQGNLIGDTGDADPFFDGTTYSGAIIVGSGGSCTGDSDGDGIINALDNCPSISNADQANFDGDSLGDVCDDSDGDGLMDSVDNCKTVANPGQENQDGDSLGDACDSDLDGDGVANTSDNCPNLANASQTDTDGDGEGDACDNDIDGDAFSNSAETYLGTNMNMACPATSTADDEAIDPWPYDFNDNQSITISDVLALKIPFGSSPGSPNWNVRMDLNQSSSITISDVLMLKPVFLNTCTP